MSVLSLPSGTILAIHSDGVITTGAVFRRKKGSVEELGRTTSSAPDPATALADILDFLKSERISPPKKVILASDRAVMVKVDLPVHPDRPRSYHQMRELARWEAELGFSDLPDWDVANILQAVDVITPEADARIRAEMERRTAAAMGGPAPRYQDVAQSLNEIDRKAREAAVELRERLSQPVGEPGCGWIPARKAGEGDNLQHPWLLTAIGEFERQIWRVACAENKLSLTGIIPSWGLTDFKARQLPQDVEDKSDQRLVLEKHNGAIFLLHLKGDAVDNIRLINIGHAPQAEEDALIQILDRRQQTKLVACGFSSSAQKDIRRSFPNALYLDDTIGAVLAGAAASALNLATAPEWPPAIAPNEPRPPIWKSSHFFRGVMIACVVLGLVVTDQLVRMKASGLQRTLTELEEEFDKKRSIKGQIEKAASHIRQLEEQVKTAQNDVDDLRRRGEIAQYLQVRRQTVVEGLLQAVPISIPQGVVMREIVESRTVPEVFTLSAWSLTDIAAEEFISRLNKNLLPFGLVVADEAVFAKTGPKNIAGYEARIRIAPAIAAAQQVEAAEGEL